MAVFGHLHHPEEAGAEILAEGDLGSGEIAPDIEDDQPLMGRHQRGYVLDHPLRGVGPLAIEGQHRIVLLGPGQGRSMH